jgi:hypothetical protein
LNINELIAADDYFKLNEKSVVRFAGWQNSQEPKVAVLASPLHFKVNIQILHHKAN